VSVTRRILGVLLQPALFALLLFGPAGTFVWWRAWVLIGVVLVATVVSMAVLARKSPALLEERFRPPLQQGQLLADKVILLVFIAAFASVIAFIPDDVFRRRIFDTPGPIISTIGLGLFVAGWGLTTLALRANAFAAPVVKPMKARRQIVVDTGVYAVVRHPMYAGTLLLLLGMPLWLESYAAALLASIPITLLAVRILVEERFLRRELAGYDAYTERVRFRVIPGVW
jgi:protein-S-isoprenylcysteine O-methyltransferase Ste14